MVGPGRRESARASVHARVPVELLRDDRQVAAERVDEQRLGVVGAVGIAERQRGGPCCRMRPGAHVRLREAVDDDRGTLLQVVADVARVEVGAAGGAARARRDVLPVLRLRSGDREGAQRASVEPDPDHTRRVPRVVVGPQHAGLRAACDEPRELGGGRVVDVPDDTCREGTAERHVRRDGLGLALDPAADERQGQRSRRQRDGGGGRTSSHRRPAERSAATGSKNSSTRAARPSRNVHTFAPGCDVGAPLPRPRPVTVTHASTVPGRA